MRLNNLFFLTLLTLVLSTSTWAQTVDQGAFMAGGNIFFTSEKFENDDKASTVFSVAPSIGFYVIDDLAVGLNLNFTSISRDGESNSSTSLAPFVRYYVVNPIFLEAQYGFSLNEGGDSFFAAGAGYSWFISQNVAVEPQVFFRSTNSDTDGFDRTSFGLSVGIQTFIGR